MTNVFNFLPRVAKSDKTDFLREADDTLEFDESARSVGTLEIFEAVKAVTSPSFVDQDWSNQELADLYRVKRLLDAAGVSIDIDRGITDEGDPWFLFLNAKGEVFIHLCRLDKLYILDSPNIQEPLRGYNFNALIDGFTNRTVAHTGRDAASSDHRVVKLERGGKVFMHPSALLAALIWTLFIAAEELVLIMPEEDSTQDLDALFADLQDAPRDLADPSLASLEGLDLGDTSHTSMDAAKETMALTDDDLYQRELGSKSILALAQNNYALGLTSIAIALGFVSDTQLAAPQDLTLSGMFSADFDSVAAVNTDESRQLAADAEQNAGPTSIEQIQTVDLTDSTVVSDSALEITTDSELLVAEVPGAAPVETLAPVENIIVAQADIELEMPTTARFDEAAEGAKEAVETTSTETVVESKPILTDSLPINTILFSASNVITTDGAFEFTAGDTLVRATFDTGQASLIDAVIPLIKTPDVISISSAPTNSKYGAYDDDARAFVDYVLSKSSDFDVFRYEQEVLIIDTAAFDTPGAATYALSWIGEDNRVISMIGVRSDFEAFDMIA